MDRLSSVKTIHSQGGLKITGNLTDCAVKGSGLFIVSEPSSDTLQTAGKMYTRVGALGFDKDGYFATRDGGRTRLCYH